MGFEPRWGRKATLIPPNHPIYLYFTIVLEKNKSQGLEFGRLYIILYNLSLKIIIIIIIIILLKKIYFWKKERLFDLTRNSRRKFFPKETY